MMAYGRRRWNHPDVVPPVRRSQEARGRGGTDVSRVRMEWSKENAQALATEITELLADHARLERELEEAEKELERRDDEALGWRDQNDALRTSLEEARQERDAVAGFIPIPFKQIVMEWEAQKARIGELEAALRDAQQAKIYEDPENREPTGEGIRRTPRTQEYEEGEDDGSWI